jgi:hypothetical protein
MGIVFYWMRQGNTNLEFQILSMPFCSVSNRGVMMSSLEVTQPAGELSAIDAQNSGNEVRSKIVSA